MANFNYNALMTSGGLSEQLGHLAGVIAGANATNRAADVASRRADIDRAFREAQLQHYKNMEERQGLSGAMNPLQQAAIREHEAKAGYYDHLTSKAAVPKPPAMLPAGQQQLPMPDVLPSNSAVSAQNTETDQAPSSMIRHVQDTLVMPVVRDKLKNGSTPHEAQGMMKSLMDQSMAGMGYPYNDQLQTYTKGQVAAPEVPGADPTSPAGASYVHQATPPWAGVNGQRSPLPSDGAPSQGGMGADTDAFGNALGGGPDSPPVAPGGLGAAMAPVAPRGLDALMPPAAFDMNSMFGSAPAPAAPSAPPAPAPAPNGKVIPGSALKAKAAQLYGGDLNAAMAHAQALGYTIDQSR